MPYALFSNSVKVSKAFPTKSDVWMHAAASGLVMEVGLGEEDPPRRIMHMGYAIQECSPDPAETETGALPPLINTGRVNPPSAAAAS